MNTLHGDGYLPPRPWDTPHEAKGLHYRDTITDEKTLIAAAKDGTLDLNDYQRWVEYGWKTPFRSLESAERFGFKLVEELKEFSDAYELYSKDPREETRQALTTEAGDIAWILTAVSSNAGAVAATATQTALPPYHNDQSNPSIGTLGTIPIRQSDQFPATNTVALITRLKAEALSYGTRHLIHHVHAPLGSLELHDFANIGMSYAMEYPHLMTLLDRILFDCGTSIRDAVADNIAKISHRRITNTLDKTDPGRLSHSSHE